MSIEIKRNKYLAITMIGLIAVGFGDTNNKDKKSNGLIKNIRSIKLEDEILEYFDKAKSRKSIYNDFYPNGSCLAVASFYIKDFAYTSYNEFKEFIASTGIQIFDNELFSWAYSLPQMLSEITGYKEYPFIIKQYNSILDDRLSNHENEIKGISSIINQFSKEPYNIIFSPIPISPYSVDYIKQNTTTTVVCETPDEVSMLHEFLHPFVGKYRNIINQRVKYINLSDFIDVQKIVDAGCMWDDSDNSKTHAIEEGIVRGLSIHLSNLNIEEKVAKVKMNHDYGFYFVSKVYDELIGKKITNKMLDQLIMKIVK